jgi:hypothetical protein
VSPGDEPFEKIYGRKEQYLNITDPNAVTSGTTFIPSSPAVEALPEKEHNWTKQDAEDFIEFLRKNPHRFILSSLKRIIYRHHLENPRVAPCGATAAERQIDSNHKHTALRFYELQDGQIYRKPELDKATGRWGAPKYVVTEADVLQLIMEVHEALLHFGNFTSTYS